MPLSSPSDHDLSDPNLHSTDGAVDPMEPMRGAPRQMGELGGPLEPSGSSDPDFQVSPDALFRQHAEKVSLGTGQPMADVMEEMRAATQQLDPDQVLLTPDNPDTDLELD